MSVMLSCICRLFAGMCRHTDVDVASTSHGVLKCSMLQVKLHNGDGESQAGLYNISLRGAPLKRLKL